jgi:hypothetical protein
MGWLTPPDKNRKFLANMKCVLVFSKDHIVANMLLFGMDKSPKQLIKEGRPSTAMKSKQKARVDYGYVRNEWSIFL